MALFNRIIEVEIGGIMPGLGAQVSPLRMTFDVTKTLDVSSNTATIEIYNMSETNRNVINILDDKVTLRAGYEESGGAQIIFIGDITRINHARRAPDVITKIESGDGIKASREKRQSVSFKEGTEAKVVLQEMADKMGLTLRPLPSKLDGQYIHGFSHVGSVKEGLDKVTDKLGLEWSIQNDELQIIEKRGVMPGVPTSISFLEGLIEAPERLTDLRDNLIGEQPKAGYKIKTLLNPSIEPGGVVILVEGPSPGMFRVERVNHKGDNYGGEFTSTIEVTEV